eukprot:evm.model.scf_875.4 EVM.evm.TU.scf_875.4   scf_875:42255-46980(-)
MMPSLSDPTSSTGTSTGLWMRVPHPRRVAALGPCHLAPSQASTSGRDASGLALSMRARLRRAPLRAWAAGPQARGASTPRPIVWAWIHRGSIFPRVLAPPLKALALGEGTVVPVEEALQDVGAAEEVVGPSRVQVQWMFLEQDMARQKMHKVQGLASEAHRSVRELLEMWNGLDGALALRRPDPAMMTRAQSAEMAAKPAPRPARSLQWSDAGAGGAVRLVASGRQPRRRTVRGRVKVTRSATRSGGYGDGRADGSSLTRLFKHMGGQGLLSREEEKELGVQVQICQGILERKKSLAQELGRDPSEKELADVCGRTEGELAIVMKKGECAKQRMLSCNMRLVVSIARRYANQSIGLDDLVAEGIFGLTKGIEKFDPSKGFKFSTYAHWWIRQAVVRSTTEQARVVKVPVHLHELASKAKKREQEVLRTEGYTPSTKQLAEWLGVPEKRLTRMKEAMRIPVSLDAPTRADRKSTVIESVEDVHGPEPEESVIRQSLKEDLDSVLDTLTPRERGILRLRYGLDDGKEKTLEQVGRHFKVTRERVRQIEAKAIRKLRHPARSDMLLEYSFTNSKRLERPTSSILRRS